MILLLPRYIYNAHICCSWQWVCHRSLWYDLFNLSPIGGQIGCFLSFAIIINNLAMVNVVPIPFCMWTWCCWVKGMLCFELTSMGVVLVFLSPARNEDSLFSLTLAHTGLIMALLRGESKEFWGDFKEHYSRLGF